MKTTMIYALVLILMISFACTQAKTGRERDKIENTLKSVSLWSDTAKIEPRKLFSSLERINQAIDSIGYPDAGYRLWIVTGDSLDFRFLIEGFWPDEETYDLINEHESYKRTMETYMDDEEEETWKSLDMKWFSLFTQVE